MWHPGFGFSFEMCLESALSPPPPTTPPPSTLYCITPQLFLALVEGLFQERTVFRLWCNTRPGRKLKCIRFYLLLIINVLEREPCAKAWVGIGSKIPLVKIHNNTFSQSWLQFHVCF